MLFSHEPLATHIREHFEPVWESLRPVPLVTIDFGNGTVVTRSLHGNIATSVCNADGRVLDILPGIYEPNTYLQRLEELEKLHRFAKQAGEHADKVVRDYHRRQAEAIVTGQPPEVFALVGGGFSIMATERPTQVILRPAERLATRAQAVRGGELVPSDAPSLDDPQELADWKTLADDTRLNETFRRRKIHEELAHRGLIAPPDVTKWLYREVLHTDLDDPYLGLGNLLFANYPFAAEEASDNSQ